MRLPRLLAGLAIGVLVTATGARAEPLDDPSSDALANTLGTLKGGARAEPLDPRLGAIDGSPENQREFNDLAAAIFSDLAARYDGDPDKMSEALARGKADPEGFADSLSPATRKRLDALSHQVEGK
ncbi:MAG TPA: hypothetical protein VGR62_05495 [Candidatus Binatia bacterium]|jgi:hypothetical protein|nr:hypothetical protein [Candidatus Binatia bacterium]